MKGCYTIKHSPDVDVFDVIAIYNLQNKHLAKITVQIDGLAAPMASAIVLWPATGQLFENVMMIHKPWGIACGIDILEKTKGLRFHVSP